MSFSLRAPQPLTASYVLDEFTCGDGNLDAWLKRRANASQVSGVSRTFVVADSGGRVFGYYAMAIGAVSPQEAAGNAHHSPPAPTPVIVLARLAVDQAAQGMQLGGALLQDAVQRALAVSQRSGVRALLVRALHERAKRFYEHYSFEESPQDARVMMLRLATDRG